MSNKYDSDGYYNKDDLNGEVYYNIKCEIF